MGRKKALTTANNEVTTKPKAAQRFNIELSRALSLRERLPLSLHKYTAQAASSLHFHFDSTRVNTSTPRNLLSRLRPLDKTKT